MIKLLFLLKYSGRIVLDQNPGPSCTLQVERLWLPDVCSILIWYVNDFGGIYRFIFLERNNLFAYLRSIPVFKGDCLSYEHWFAFLITNCSALVHVGWIGDFQTDFVKRREAVEQDWPDSCLRHFDNQFVFFQGVHVDGTKFIESTHSHFVTDFKQSGITNAIAQIHSYVKCTTFCYWVDDRFCIWIFDEYKFYLVLIVPLTKQEHFSIPSQKKLFGIHETISFSDQFNSIIMINFFMM